MADRRLVGPIWNRFSSLGLSIFNLLLGIDVATIVDGHVVSSADAFGMTSADETRCSIVDAPPLSISFDCPQIIFINY